MRLDKLIERKRNEVRLDRYGKKIRAQIGQVQGDMRGTMIQMCRNNGVRLASSVARL